MPSTFHSNYFPNRIICLTEETTEFLYLLGEEDRIVGISGFTKRPPEARKNKPKVSAFVEANIDKILALQPDLVIGFSDIQANIAQALILKGITVWVNNHRSVQGILNMMVQLGTLVDKKYEAIAIVEQIKTKILAIQTQTNQWKIKPKVYFEEWDDPMISGIQWVSEIIELAGGVNVFQELTHKSLAKDRIIKDQKQVIEQNPDIILASWCGKKFKKDNMLNRAGWSSINAIKADEVYEIESSIILQPGPASLMEGLPLLHNTFKNWIIAREQS